MTLLLSDLERLETLIADTATLPDVSEAEYTKVWADYGTLQDLTRKSLPELLRLAKIGLALQNPDAIGALYAAADTLEAHKCQTLPDRLRDILKAVQP